MATQTEYLTGRGSGTGMQAPQVVTTGTTSRQWMLPRGAVINIQGVVTPTVAQRPVVQVCG